jgi:coenzyme Q-binding protein COQ10
MPRHTETRNLPYSPEQMFDLVADVKRYQEFLPWVAATRVRSDSPSLMVADLVVGFKSLKETFTSRVEKHRPTAIMVDYIEGPAQTSQQQLEIPAGREGAHSDSISSFFLFLSVVLPFFSCSFFSFSSFLLILSFSVPFLFLLVLSSASLSVSVGGVDSFFSPSEPQMESCACIFGNQWSVVWQFFYGPDRCSIRALNGEGSAHISKSKRNGRGTSFYKIIRRRPPPPASAPTQYKRP